MKLAGLWRAWLPLLLVLWLTQFGAQIELAWLAHHHSQAPLAGQTLWRVAWLDALLSMACGVVAAGALARAPQPERAARLGELAAWLALLSPMLTLAGLALYPWLGARVSPSPEVAAALRAAWPLFALTAPVRLLAHVGLLLLHALGDWRRVAAYKTLELALRAGLCALWAAEQGVLGVVRANAIGAALLAALCALSLARACPGWTWPRWPRLWRLCVDLGWEARRLGSAQLFALAGLSAFAAWPAAHGDDGRFAAYCLGSALALLCQTPLLALLRALMVWLPSLSPHQQARTLRGLALRGLPWAVALALLAALACHQWGVRVYQLHGDWWLAFVCCLAAALPARYLGNLHRARCWATGDFARVARHDSVLTWMLGLPCMLAGLALDAPWLGCGYLLWPECAWLWLQRRKHVTAQPILH